MSLIATTRREASRLARQDAIIAVARSVFLERGYANTSMSEIALLLGGSKATLWTYFPSKEKLFAAVIDRASQDLNAILESTFDAGDNLHETLARFASNFVARVTSPFALGVVRLIAAEVDRFPELGEIFYERAVGRVIQHLSDYLLREMEAGNLLPANPHEAAQQLCALLRQPAQVSIWFGDNVRGAKIDIDAALAMFLRSYRPDRPK